MNVQQQLLNAQNRYAALVIQQIQSKRNPLPLVAAFRLELELALVAKEVHEHTEFARLVGYTVTL